MLSDVLEEGLIQLNLEAADWEDAIRKSAQVLLDAKKATPGYVADIIAGVHEHGPYIVITKHVALPHARPESGALTTAIGISVLKDPIVFGSEDNDPVKVLFPLVAADNTAHLNALSSLIELLSDPDFLPELIQAQSAHEVLTIVAARERKNS